MRLYDQKRHCHTSNCCPVVDLVEGGILLFHDPDEFWRGFIRLLPGELDAILEYARPLLEASSAEAATLYETPRLCVVGYRDGTVVITLKEPLAAERYVLTRVQWNLFLREASIRFSNLAA